MAKHEGLGDSIEALLNLPGIKSVVKTVVPDAGTEGCGCQKRKEKLNKLVPYN